MAVEPLGGGTIGRAVVQANGVQLTAADAALQSQTADYIANFNKMTTAMKGDAAEAITSAYIRQEGSVELAGGKYGGNKGFDHVVVSRDGEVTIIVDSKTIQADGSFRLGSTDNGLQLSKEWIDNVLEHLPDGSSAKQAVVAADKNNTLLKAVAGVDRTSGKLTLVRVK